MNRRRTCMWSTTSLPVIPTKRSEGANLKSALHFIKALLFLLLQIPHLTNIHAPPHKYT